MKVQVSVEYTVSLNASEYRLMGLALAGKIRHRTDKIGAMALNRKLQSLRSKNLKQISDQATSVEAQSKPKVDTTHEAQQVQSVSALSREDGDREERQCPVELASAVGEC